MLVRWQEVFYKLEFICVVPKSGKSNKEQGFKGQRTSDAQKQGIPPTVLIADRIKRHAL
jgi:hypothetical protein